MMGKELTGSCKVRRGMGGEQSVHRIWCTDHLCPSFSVSACPAPLAGIPNAYYFGQEGLHNILCIDLLGPSLEDLFDMCGRKFTIKTVVMLAKQMVSDVQLISP